MALPAAFVVALSTAGAGMAAAHVASAAGTFYEGVMTSGYPSDATENAVQANIVAAGYR
ncbi:arabinofuranosidase catalytic domain-containing protein [Nonomuraea sp. JJY05]|uniref:arabinofuranosidase catalytic domain-containing protein n=1 Tax=Nonomuraea sp. JJY05 TaxID=3350255 RepID=UPI00373F1CDB